MIFSNEYNCVELGLVQLWKLPHLAVWNINCFISFYSGYIAQFRNFIKTLFLSFIIKQKHFQFTLVIFFWKINSFVSFKSRFQASILMKDHHMIQTFSNKYSWNIRWNARRSAPLYRRSLFIMLFSRGSEHTLPQSLCYFNH